MIGEFEPKTSRGYVLVFLPKTAGVSFPISCASQLYQPQAKLVKIPLQGHSCQGCFATRVTWDDLTVKMQWMHRSVDQKRMAGN